MAGSSGLPLAGVEAIVEGLSAFQGDVRQMNSALESIHPRQTLLQRGFSSLTSGLVDFGKGILQWGVDSLAEFGRSILHVAEYALGQLLADAIQFAITKIRELIGATIDAGSEFQTLELRLNGMNLQAISEQQLDYVDATEAAVKMTQEQLDWLQRLAATTPFDNTDISNVYTLARSYGFADDEARVLTESTSDFTASMGLSGDVLERVIHNFGQMVARGKITSTEIRDLARGAFLPVNDILQRIADNLNKTGEAFVDNSADIEKTKNQIEDYVDKLNILKQKQSEWTDKTKESTKMALVEQMEELQEKIDGARTKLSTLQTEAAQPGKLTIADVTKMIQTPEGLPAQLFIDAFNEMIQEEPRFTGAAERMAKTFKAASDNALDIVKSIGGLQVVKPILDVIGGRIAEFTEAFTGTDRWDRLVAAATRVGQALSRIIEDLFLFLPDTESLADNTISAVNRLADWLNEHRMEFAMFFQNAYNFIKDQLIPKIVEIFNTIKGAIQEFQTSGFSVNFLEKLGFSPETAEKIIGFVDRIRDTLDRISEWYTENSGTISEFFKTVGEIVSEFISDLTGGGAGQGDATGDILDGITKFMQFVIDNKDEILKWIEILWSIFAVWQVLSTIWNIAIGIVISLGGFILGLIAIFGTLSAFISGPVLAAIGIFIGVIAAAILIGKAFGDAIVKFLFWIRDNITWIDWRALGMFIIQGLINGVNQFIPGLGEALIGGMMMIYNKLLNFLGIHSPSTLFAGIGYNMIEGMANGIMSGAEVVSGALNHIISVVDNALNHVISVAEDKINHLASILGNQGMNWFDLGESISTAWAYGIESAGEKGDRAMEDMASNAAEMFQAELRMRSPSKVFEEFGKLTVEGFAQGIEKAAGLATGAMQTVASAAMVPAFSSMAVAQASGNTITNNRTANLTINSSAPVEPIMQDFHMLETLIGA